MLDGPLVLFVMITMVTVAALVVVGSVAMVVVVDFLVRGIGVIVFVSVVAVVTLLGR
jgi:hypothetical protein